MAIWIPILLIGIAGLSIFSFFNTGSPFDWVTDLVSTIVKASIGLIIVATAGFAILMLRPSPTITLILIGLMVTVGIATFVMVGTVFNQPIGSIFS